MMSAGVTVVIPVFNAESTVLGAIRSAQAVGNARVLVVDDGSTDSSGRLARESGVEVVTQENAGASEARRAALQHVKTDFVIFLDADDEVNAVGVEASMALLQRDSTLAVAAGRVIGVDPNGKRRLLPRAYETVEPTSLLTQGFGPWPPAAAVMRRAALQAAEELELPALRTRYAEDYELIIRLSLIGPVVMHDEVSAIYALYSGKSSAYAGPALRDKELIREHYARSLNVPVSLFSPSQLRAAVQFRRSRVSRAHGARLRPYMYGLLGLLASPSLVGSKVISRVHRRRSGTPVQPEGSH
jgi:glycosyltransferase involved in cell wall biosynthesis